MARFSLEDTYYGGVLPDVNITAAAPSIKTKKGEKLAKIMARDVYQGKMQFKDVPKDYQSYIEGEVKGAIPYAQKYHPGARVIGLTSAGIMGYLGGVAPTLEFLGKHPLLNSVVNFAGGVDTAKNLLSNNGISKTIRLIKEGDKTGAIKSGIGDLLDIGLSFGNINSLKYLNAYRKGVNKKLAEAIIRGGDAMSSPTSLIQQIANKKALNYIFNPRPNPRLAYQLPFRYSGENASWLEGAHYGDIVDQFLGKTPVPDAIYDTSILSKEMQDYINTFYKGKRIPIRDLGYQATPIGENYVDLFNKIKGSKTPVRINGSSIAIGAPKNLLDPGGFQSYARVLDDNNILLDNADIWKFNSRDYSKRYFKREKFSPLKRLGLRFIDNQGTPIVHLWKDIQPIPEYFKIDNNNRVLKNTLNSDIPFKSGGKIYIKPSHRGRLTRLKARTGKSESELYNDGNPAHRKMVVFARNARKWKR